MKKTILLFLGLALSLIINAQTQGVLQTTLSANNGYNGAMFVLLNTSNNYISIDGFDALLSDSLSSYPVAIFYRMNRYAGYETDSAPWVLLQNDTVTSMGNGALTHITLNTPKVFAPNDSLAFYISTPSAYGLKYSDGDSIFSNADISFIPGAGKNAYFGSNTFSPRMWNGNIYYHLIGDQQVVSADTSICEGDSVLLQVSAQEEQGFEWYDATSGGNIISYADTFLTPNLNDTTFYYPYSLHNYFYDNAEVDKLSNYTINSSNATLSRDNSQFVSGDYSLKYDGNYSTFNYDNIFLNGINPNYISYNIYPTTAGASQALFAIQDGLSSNISSQLVWIYVSQGNTLRYISGGNTSNDFSISLNQWYKIELKNINYETQTFDFWVNGMEIAADLGFRGTAKKVDKIFFGNYDNAVSYYDDIEIGHVIYSATDTVTVNTQICAGITENGDKYISKIYPNPVQDQLTIETETQAKSVNIILTDMTGKLILQKNNISNYEQINLSNLQAGVYFIKLIYDGKVETKKIIKE